jgi:hypothetical protein
MEYHVIDMTPYQSVTEKINIYFKSRKSLQSRQNSQSILKYLLDIHDKNPKNGWVQAKQLVAELVNSGKFESDTALFRQLQELTKHKLISRSEKIEQGPRSLAGKKKPSVYYKINLTELPSLQEAVSGSISPAGIKSIKLGIAKELLIEYGCEDPESEIENRLKKNLHISDHDDD